jgi:hypothetical protein
MSDTDGSLERSARAMLVAACLALGFAARAAAQQPVIAPAPQEAEFLSRYDFRLSAAALVTTESAPTGGDDPRFAWDMHLGGSVDVADCVRGRAGITIDYQAVLGSEYLLFDPNQGTYTLEGFVSVRLGRATEIAGLFHHVSRHLSDRPKRFAIAWNELGGRLLHQVTLGSTTLDVDLEGGRAVQHSFVDYTWMSELGLLLRHPLSDRTGVFVHGAGQVFAVDESLANRGFQTGGLVEAGLRLNGRAGALELFAGFEKRVDADPQDRLPRRWGLAGFRLLSR